MIKKIWLLLVVLLTLVAYNAGMPAFAEELSEEERVLDRNTMLSSLKLVTKLGFKIVAD